MGFTRSVYQPTAYIIYLKTDGQVGLRTVVRDGEQHIVRCRGVDVKGEYLGLCTGVNIKIDCSGGRIVQNVVGADR